MRQKWGLIGIFGSRGHISVCPLQTAYKKIECKELDFWKPTPPTVGVSG